MKLTCRLLVQRRQAMILPTALVLTALLLSLFAMTVSQGLNRAQAWHELIQKQQLESAFLIAKRNVANGVYDGMISFGRGQRAEWFWRHDQPEKQRQITVTLYPSGVKQHHTLDKIY
ncbi:hypothetical protein [Schleiferilactobacillus harbinensis]|jgi:hypothetical protein|uniref:hypothetical protein n=1 Tax=Schleiferilactobacillus harbinensis TaxID=304207 RepID=UPI00123BD2C9|nr:hypothetical protein [Schleiferilactobacillus harbinensis]QEU46928.1 hypothetical protein FMM01_06250 [Schleiferilactobacillus harbinensis]